MNDRIKASMPGIFISLEGIEASGKTTQVEKLATTLRKSGYEVVTTKAPGGTVLANELRQLFLDHNDKVDAVTELGLLMTSMRANYMETIQPALQAGKIVISDRFTHTTRAIQCGAKKTPYHLYHRMMELFLPQVETDLSIYYRLSPEEAKVRVNRRGGMRSNLDNESLEFFRAQVESYDRMFSSPDLAIWDGRLAVVDAEQSVDDVFSNSLDIIKDRLANKWDTTGLVQVA